MTLEQALKRNPYNPSKGNESAYIRYLRYTVDGYYEKDSAEVRKLWKEYKGKTEEEEEWGIIIRTLILFIAFLVYVEVR